MKPISLVLPGGNSFSQAHSGPGQENPAAKRGWKQLWDSRCGWIGKRFQVRLDRGRQRGSGSGWIHPLDAPGEGFGLIPCSFPAPKLQQTSDPQGKNRLQRLSASFPNSSYPKGNRGSSSVRTGNSRDGPRELLGCAARTFWDVGELWGWNPGWNPGWNLGRNIPRDTGAGSG